MYYAINAKMVKFLEKLNEEEIIAVTFVMCNIWLSRNSIVFQNVFKGPQLVIHTTTREREEYLTTIGHDGQPRKYLTKRILPALGGVKLNWDASMDKTKNRMGIHIIINDDLGEFLVCLSSSSISIVSYCC